MHASLVSLLKGPSLQADWFRDSPLALRLQVRVVCRGPRACLGDLGSNVGGVLLCKAKGRLRCRGHGPGWRQTQHWRRRVCLVFRHSGRPQAGMSPGRSLGAGPHTISHTLPCRPHRTHWSWSRPPTRCCPRPWASCCPCCASSRSREAETRGKGWHVHAPRPGQAGGYRRLGRLDL